MKKTHLYLFLSAAIAVSISLSSCNMACKKGSGNVKSETRTINNFSQLSLEGGSYKVILTQGPTVSLKITGDDNLMGDIESDVSGNKLTVKTEGNICPSGETVLNITVKDLSYLGTSGMVDISSDGKIITKDIEFDFSGTTKLTLNLEAANVTTTGSGMIDLTLTGQATTHKVAVSGSAQIDALDFVVGKYDIESSGAGSYKINVLTNLKVNTSGTSDIQYRGNPANVDNNQSGAGSIKKID